MKENSEFKITADVIEECLRECLGNEQEHEKKDKPHQVSSR